MSGDEEQEGTVEDIAKDVLPEKIEQPAVPIALDKLYPWHRPRKQWVRSVQWCHLSSDLMDKLVGAPGVGSNQSANPEFRYLTLPGIDYFDVRLVGEECLKKGWKLTATGFLAGSVEKPLMARAQFTASRLIDTGLISRSSITLPNRIEEVSSNSSQAYKEIQQRAPFHAINVDACGSIAPPSADHANRLVDAIHRIVELQLKTAVHRWLLFITTNVRPDNLSPETLSKLTSVIYANAAKNEKFESDAPIALVDTQGTIAEAVTEAASENGIKFVRLFSMGIGKWLLNLARQKNWSVKMHRSCCYSTPPDNQYEPSMPSLAFEFVPPPPGLEDSTGVSRAKPAEGGLSEDLSLRVVEHVRQMIDLDELLVEDPQLATELKSQTTELLTAVGYTEEALRQFAEENFG